MPSIRTLLLTSMSLSMHRTLDNWRWRTKTLSFLSLKKARAAQTKEDSESGLKLASKWFTLWIIVHCLKTVLKYKKLTKYCSSDRRSQLLIFLSRHQTFYLWLSVFGIFEPICCTMVVTEGLFHFLFSVHYKRAVLVNWLIQRLSSNQYETSAFYRGKRVQCFLIVFSLL